MTDLQRLRVLSEVARHGSFNKAAAALHVTPSAVSQQIAALERGVGTAVVARSPRGVALTESGRLLVEAEEAISAELRHARDQIARLSEGRGRLTVATFTSGGRHLLPAALTVFTAAQPGVEVHVVEHEPEGSLPLVRQGVADLALAYHFDGPPPARTGDRSGLAWEPLMADPLSVVVPTGHRLAGRDTVEISELADDPWVLGCRKTEAFLRRYAGIAGFDLRISGSTSDYFFAVSLVAAGVGITLAPYVSLLAPPPGVVVLPVEPPRPTRHFGIVTARRTRSSHQLVAAMADALRTAAAEHAPAG
ncbi:LysR family transcriptional regulator [Yinghuangia seranimata]|uniref:LysR family transcriptional regulator n=1 Tax=Yinghuangia seranimata TaxID=408067 RepID=UPI00248C084F|nr:LysR substrate-binding domain-containing protein [Yinghuangia seranimata]MDI2125973.1 LysR substrate-binding domain-containing protein [Yinghuangia seranimata]